MTRIALTRNTPRAVALIAVVVVLGLLASSDALHALLLRLFDAARVVISQHRLAGPLAFIALAMLSSMLAFFSSAVLVPPAVLAWGSTRTAAYLLVGWMLGGLAAYSLARTVGRPALRWLTPRRQFEQDATRVTRDMPWGLVLLFQLALPSEIPGFVLGLARYPVGRYLVALGLAELPYAVGTVMLGVSFVERRIGVLFALGAVAVLAAAFVAPALRRRLR